MMQKLIIFILFTLLLSFSASAQLEVAFSTTSTPVPGGSVDVDVSVSNFDDIVTLQYFILWDSLVLSYDSIFNITDQLEQFTIGSIGTPETAVTLDDGEMSVSWSHSTTDPFTIPDDTRLFTVRMNVVGTDCDSTAIGIGDIPPFQNIEVIDADFNDIGAVSNLLPFAIPGTDCGSGGDGGGGDGGGGATDIVVSSNNVSADNGSSICIPVIVDNFTDVSTAQGSIMWDPTVLSFTGTANDDILPGITYGAGSVDQGMHGFSWFDNSAVTPVTLPNGTTLYEVCFDVIGAASSSSTIKFTDSPVMIVFSDSNDEELGFTTTTSTFSVNSDGGGDGGGGGADDLVLTMEDVQANAGSNVCIPMTAENFTNIATFQGALMWDASVLSYTGIDNSVLPGMVIGDANADQGILGFNWFDNTTVTPVTIATGGTLFEICFDVIAGIGGTSQLNIIDNGNIFIEASTSDGDILDITTDSGTFTVAGGGDFELNCSEVTFESGQNGCIDVTAIGFSDVASIQFPMTWDDSQLTYDRVDNLNSSISLGMGAFNQTQNNVIRFSWDSPNSQGMMIPDGSVLFSICFDAITCSGDDLTGSFEFGGDAQVPLEVGSGQGLVVASSASACDYTINCVDDTICTINFGTATISPPSCFSQSTGSISINPTAVGCTDPVECTWFQGFAGGGVIANTGPGCNLTGVLPGTYVLRVTVGITSEEQTFIIPNTDPLSITGTTLPVSCNSLGSVSTVITGGSGTYSCEWPHNGAIGCDIGGLESGTYSLFVTDAILGCTQSVSFPIGVDFNASGMMNKVDADCDGGSISITMNQAGPWDYEWSHPEGTNSPNQNGLAPGAYSCTVTSASGNCSIVLSTTIVYAGTLVSVENIVTTTTSCNGNDGTADFMIAGGCLPYDCEVQAADGTIISCDSLTNLTAGVYGIHIIDASTTGAIVVPFTISMTDPIAVVPAITNATMTTPGTIFTTVTGGMPGYFYEWSPESGGIVQGAPNQSNLEAGAYNLTVTDLDGCTWVSASDLVVGGDPVEPGAPVISQTMSIATICGDVCDGQYNAVVTGEGPFNFALTNLANNVTTEYEGLPFTGLCGGEYNLIVTDILGLSTTANVSIGGNPAIEIDAEVECDNGTTSGSILLTVVGGTGVGYTYVWTQIEDDTMNPENLDAGIYEVIVTDSDMCSVSNLIEVEDCTTPPPTGECGDSSTVLTPNGDDVNANLFVMCASDYPNTFAVYDRWGRLVHEAVNYDGGWEGTDLNGDIVTEGVYYWVMDSSFESDHRIFKGYVNVIRETK